MSSTPFRAAFCALGLAFAMSILLAIPNPSKIRTALRAHRQKPVPVSEQTLMASVKTEKTEKRSSARRTTAPVEVASAPVSKRVVEERPQPEPVVAEAPKAPEVKRPIQVASSNPSASLGMTAPELPAPAAPVPTPAVPVPAAPTVAVPAPVLPTPAAPPVPVKPELATIPPFEIAAAPQPVPAPVPAELTANPVASSGAPALTIPVPDPIQQTSRSLTTAPAFPLEVEEPAIIGPAPIGLTNTNTAPTVDQHGAEVRPGTSPKTWNFRFDKTPLPVALRLLGDQAGSSILVEPEIDGTFSGQFFDADPAQVLAMVVKAHRFSVTRRGGYLLIGIRDDAGARGRSQR